MNSISFRRNDYYRQIIIKRQEIIANNGKTANTIIHIYISIKQKSCEKNFQNAQHIFHSPLHSLPNMNRRRMLDFCGLWHLHMQYTIFELSINARFINIVDVEGTAYRAHTAFTADVIALVILLVVLRLLLSSNRELTVLITELYILFLHAGQVGSQLVAVAVILDIHPHAAIGIKT